MGLRAMFRRRKQQKKECLCKINEMEGYLWSSEMLRSERATAGDMRDMLTRARTSGNYTSFDDGIRRAVEELNQRKRTNSNVVNLRG